MLHFIQRTLRIVYRAGYNLVYNDGIELAGYLAFLHILAIFPFLVLLVSVLGLMGQSAMGAEWIDFLMHHLPQEAVAALTPRIDEISSGPPQSILTLAVLGAIWTSSSAVEGLRTVLNRAYKVSDPPHFFFRRLVSIGQVLLFTFMVALVMLVLVLAPLAVHSLIQIKVNILAALMANILVPYFFYIGAGTLFLAIAGMYYVLPNLRQSLVTVVPGALLVTILWIVGAKVMGNYFAQISTVSVIYGSLSSFIVTLIFIFVMNVMFIYGAEFNHALMDELGRHAEEREHGENSPNDQVIKNRRIPTKDTP